MNLPEKFQVKLYCPEISGVVQKMFYDKGYTAGFGTKEVESKWLYLAVNQINKSIFRNGQLYTESGPELPLTDVINFLCTKSINLTYDNFEIELRDDGSILTSVGMLNKDNMEEIIRLRDGNANKPYMPDRFTIETPCLELHEAVQKILFRYNYCWGGSSKKICSDYRKYIVVFEKDRQITHGMEYKGSFGPIYSINGLVDKLEEQKAIHINLRYLDNAMILYPNGDLKFGCCTIEKATVEEILQKRKDFINVA